MEPLRRPGAGLGQLPLAGPSSLRGEADVEGLKQRDCRGRPRRSRLHHLHQRHRRRAARRPAAPRRDPPQSRRRAPTSSRPISAGATRCSCRSCRRAMPTSIPAGRVPDRARRADLLRGEPREARRQHRGSAADDHGRRAAAVRDAARADHEVDRGSRAGCRNICLAARSRSAATRRRASSSRGTCRWTASCR